MRVNTLQDELQVANEASTPHEQNAGNNDIVQQAMFQRKECMNQAADDEGYLFGCSCGTAPRDELV